MRKPDLQRLRESTKRRLQLDLIALAGMVVLMVLMWHNGGRWFMLGAIVMFLPIIWTHTSRALGVAVLLDKAGFERGTPGRHSGEYTGRE